jgi:FkbM family methyltransferase
VKNLKRIFKRNTHNLFFKSLAGLGRSMNRLYENRNHDIYSNGELTVIKKLAKYNPLLVVDGGANIGKYSLMLNQLIPNCKIYAFEPVGTTFDQLKENTANYPNIFPVNAGLFSENCTKEIQIFSSNTHASLYDLKKPATQTKEKVSIDLTRGDYFFEENQIADIDFLKLDIEGAEYEAILGFDAHFKNKKIKMVQFEYGYINISSRKLLLDFYTLLNDYGYTVGKIFPKHVEFREYAFKHENFLGPNFIAVDRNEVALIESLRKK